jgi:pimeloyl-ACP methyl ester carboxylesterase
MIELPFTLENRHGETLVGVHHRAEEARATIIMLHGWSGTRCGPHQMLTRAARSFAASGFDCVRFDFAGRGDSDGDTALATLATMRDDARDVFRWVETQSGGPLWVLGLCSGCEIAVASVEPQLKGAILWSAPIFAALPEQAGQEQKRAANLKRYAQKLLRPSTYLKILRGQVDTRGVKSAMAGSGGAAHKNVESNQAGQLPPGFRVQSLKSWRGFGGQIFQIYGGADPIVSAASAFYAQNSPPIARAHTVDGANHSFYGLSWEQEVIETTAKWLNESTHNKGE